MLSRAMAEITVYITEPTEVCMRVTRLLDERRLEYSLVMIETRAEMAELTERTGLQRCPVVVVGDTVVGGFNDVREADNSGRLAELAAA
jgi:glutaredoxin 3